MKAMQNRRALVAGLGAALAALTAGVRPARAQAAPGGFTPARHDADRWMDQVPGTHRVFVDSANRSGGQDAVLYANNLFNTNQAAYGIAPADLAMIVCFRHFSTPFGYNDAIWAKYGAILSQFMQLPAAATTNPVMNGIAGMPPGIALAPVLEKGLVVAICANATRYIAGQIAGQTRGPVDAIFTELTANAVPKGRFVPAGVVAATRAQEYGYSLLSCA
jgi:hypothetical protein